MPFRKISKVPSEPSKIWAQLVPVAEVSRAIIGDIKREKM